MNYNFSDALRAVLVRARDEAKRMGHDHVGTEHLLLGLLGNAEIADLLDGMGASTGEIRAMVEGSVRPGTAVGIAKGEIPYTGRTKKVLEYALASARLDEGKANSKTVDVRHLLLGLLREHRGIAADVLTQLGITEKRVLDRRGVRRAGGASRRFRIVLDDSSSRSIYEQIVAQVTEAVATRVLHPGERLPTVRQLADELDIAPGTVARAYGELERQGLLVTEGARGTRVADRIVSRRPDPEAASTLAGLLRPVAVAAFHLGATAADLRRALEEAMAGIFDEKGEAGSAA